MKYIIGGLIYLGAIFFLARYCALNRNKKDKIVVCKASRNWKLASKLLEKE